MVRMIYFDNAATTKVKPQCVIDAVVYAMQTMGNSGRGAHDASLDASRVIFDARHKLAKFFGAKNPKQIAFTANSTESLNIAIKGTLAPGDHVISTELEHNSVLRPLYELKTQGADVTFIKSSSNGTIDYSDFEKSIKANTKVIVCTHGSNLTGNLLDIKKIGEIAHKHQLIFIVDASQTAGVFPIDVQEMHIDILCFTGHKSLLGPQGTGGIYVREGLEVKPLKTGGSGVQTYSETHPAQMPTALEAGTLNGHGIAGLGAAISYINSEGIDSIRQKEQALMWRFYDGIKDIHNIKIYGDFTTKDRCPIVTINLGDYDSSDVSDELYMTYGICTRPGAHCAPLMHYALGSQAQGAVRFSFSHFNTEEEVDVAIAALHELADQN